MKEILLPFDFSDCSRRALTLAMRGFPFGKDVRLTVVHVVESTLVKVDSVREALGEEVERARAGGPGLTDLELQVIRGRVIPELTGLLRSARYDGLLIGGQGHGGAAEAVLGTTARRIIRQTTAPAYVVKRDRARGLPAHMLAAVADVDPARSALVVSRDIAKRFGIIMETMTTIQVDAWPAADLYPTRLSGGLARELHDEQARACTEAERALRRLEVDLFGEVVSSAQHADHGSVVSSIVRQAERYDLLVLGARPEARTVFASIGSTIEGVLERCRTDIFIAR